MKLPVIINLDSKYDWTKEVQNILDTIDCKKLHKKFPTISKANFKFRLNQQLKIIGLCSPSFIDRFYFRQDNCHERARDNNDWIYREEENWRMSQIGEERNVRHFNGEEPHFRSPKICDNYIVEPYGIYTDDCSILLPGEADMDKLLLSAKGEAGIFLCPERIVEIYPTLMEVLSNPKYALPLADNPILANLKMVLLHELGHHIFPVHRNCNGKKYISEGLANYFCYSNLDAHVEQAGLLYKSRTLQPPEYSSYRFISILHRYYNQKPKLDKGKIKRQIKELYNKGEESDSYILDAKTLERVLQELEDHIAYSHILTIDDVFARAFEGFIDGWNNIFLKETITEEADIRDWTDVIIRQTEHLTMAIAVDSLPTVNFLNDLDEYYANKGRWSSRFEYEMIFKRRLHYKKQINPDFVWDLYNENSILPFVLSEVMPNEIWRSWGMSTSRVNVGTGSKLPGKLSWPEGPLFRMTTRQDWERIVKESPYQWARDAAIIWILNDLNNKSDIANFLSGFTLSGGTRNWHTVINSFNKYSGQFNTDTKNKIISILQETIKDKDTVNLTLKREAEKLIEKLRTNSE